MNWKKNELTEILKTLIRKVEDGEVIVEYMTISREFEDDIPEDDFKCHTPTGYTNWGIRTRDGAVRPQA